MNDDDLLDETFAGTAREQAWQASLAAGRQAAAGRRHSRLRMRLVTHVATVTVFLAGAAWLAWPTRSAAPPPTEPAHIAGVEVITAEELFALFGDRGVALVSAGPGRPIMFVSGPSPALP